MDIGAVISGESDRTTGAEIKGALQEPEARIGRHKSGRSLVVECAAFKDSRSEPLIREDAFEVGAEHKHRPGA